MFAQVVYEQPFIDWHALAPELTILAFGMALTVIDIVWLERARSVTSALAGVGMLAALVPVATLALDGQDRVLFDGAYVVDDFSLIMKAVFLVTGYVVVLLSTNYIAEGDYWENEYYGLLSASVAGMIMMASCELISIFVALELLSIPAYMLATWRKRDDRSNEAGLKYYLMGVFATAVMLYGMSLVYGASGSTKLSDINIALSGDSRSVWSLGIIFVIVGFAFKVSAVPFHTWAPDVYEGAPTPVTAFLSVGSKAAGFVALLAFVFVGFFERDDVYEPAMWALAAASMTVGNLIALRQTNVVRLLAYSGIAQAGFMLAPLAVAHDIPDDALRATVIYLVIYAAMNLGAFAVVIAMARKTRSAELDSFNGAFHFAPALTVAMTFFLFSLAGIPPLGGWFAKFVVFRAVLAAGTPSGALLAVVVAVNSVIALFYYASLARRMWVEEPADGDVSPVRLPVSLAAAVGLAAIATLAFGVFPPLVTEVTEVSLVNALAGVSGTLERLVIERIESQGPLRFDDFVELALYHPSLGFYATVGSAGRRGDFLTSPEVGPLFGAVIANALDVWWAALGSPSPFVVAELGAGPGTLARSVAAARPRCASALEYWAVERAASQRARHPENVVSSGELPDACDVVVANEALDNVAFGVRRGGARLHVGVERGRLVEVWVGTACEGPRLPDQARAAALVEDGLARCRGPVVFIDYMVASAADLDGRDWLRTYRGHERGDAPLVDPGSQDITCDVVLEWLPTPDRVSSQTDFLRSHGIDDLVEEGRAMWAKEASRGGLDALRGRSRIREAEALLDPMGLGGFTVVEYRKSPG